MTIEQLITILKDISKEFPGAKVAISIDDYGWEVDVNRVEGIYDTNRIVIGGSFT